MPGPSAARAEPVRSRRTGRQARRRNRDWKTGGRVRHRGMELLHQPTHGRYHLTPRSSRLPSWRLHSWAPMQDVLHVEPPRVHNPPQPQPPPVRNVHRFGEAREGDALRGINTSVCRSLPSSPIMLPTATLSSSAGWARKSLKSSRSSPPPFRSSNSECERPSLRFLALPVTLHRSGSTTGRNGGAGRFRAGPRASDQAGALMAQPLVPNSSAAVIHFFRVFSTLCEAFSTYSGNNPSLSSLESSGALAAWSSQARRPHKCACVYSRSVSERARMCMCA